MNADTIDFKSLTMQQDEALRVMLKERPLFMRVLMAAYDVIEHRTDLGLINSMYPYEGLKRALDKLAKGVK